MKTNIFHFLVYIFIDVSFIIALSVTLVSLLQVSGEGDFDKLTEDLEYLDHIISSLLKSSRKVRVEEHYSHHIMTYEDTVSICFFIPRSSIDSLPINEFI